MPLTTIVSFPKLYLCGSLLLLLFDLLLWHSTLVSYTGCKCSHIVHVVETGRVVSVANGVVISSVGLVVLGV